MFRAFGILTLLLVLMTGADSTEGAFPYSYTAYNVSAGQPGNQNFGGALGMDFDLQHAIVVTHLGAFDSNSDGINGTIETRLWNRAGTPAVVVGPENFTGSGDPLEGGSRIRALGTPVILPFGFQGTIAAGGYNALELNGNSVTPPWTTDNGAGLLQFVGGGRYQVDGNPSLFPANGDGGPANRYAAGTFKYKPANIAFEVASGVDGNQGFGGALGLDATATRDLEITHLGVFDDDSNGLDHALTAQLWSRNNNGTPGDYTDDSAGVKLAEVVFAAGTGPTSGELIGGSRFLPLSSATLFNGFTGLLPTGSEVTMVGYGYDANEENGNNLPATANAAWGRYNAITFGRGRYDLGTNVFPSVLDSVGLTPRYAAGTFRFNVVPEPASIGLLVVGALAMLRLRRR